MCPSDNRLISQAKVLITTQSSSIRAGCNRSEAFIVSVKGRSKLVFVSDKY